MDEEKDTEERSGFFELNRNIQHCIKGENPNYRLNLGSRVYCMGHTHGECPFQEYDLSRGITKGVAPYCTRNPEAVKVNYLKL